ncbi:MULTISPECIES: DUF3703 domain-containing protein [Sphingopyxis]|uniref:DUF3703 domain-containing protein n=1 Tax=Sphingopyxis TaxID=165697 RepID=UPI000A61C228|nr:MULTISPECIES: DUF3703 domain-containing protein [Sphingopyxis]
MDTIDRKQARKLIAGELDRYRAARTAGDGRSAWIALERAHVVAQSFFALHLASHWRMLGYALALGDGREAAGQLFRLALVPLGSLTGRLPVGNTGRARISAFKPMPIPSDLEALISQRDKMASGR